MTPRRRARELALQGIYQWLYTGASPAQVLKNLSELEDFESELEELAGVLDEVELESDLALSPVPLFFFSPLGDLPFA